MKVRLLAGLFKRDALDNSRPWPICQHMLDLPRENVQDYPRPPALEPVPQQIRILFAGAEIAATDRVLRVLETHHAPTYYLPPDAFTATLRPVSGGSFCEWKGRASYWDIEVDGKTAKRAAWSYARPSARFAAIKDHIAVYAWAMDACFVGNAKVEPQPGDFYGGWVTDNLDGIVKGGPGTESW